MNELEKIIKTLGPMEHAFDCVRLIDTESRCLRSERISNSCSNKTMEFNYDNFEADYEKAIALDAVTYKLKAYSSTLWLFIMIPAHAHGKNYILECAVHMIDNFEMNQNTDLFGDIYRMSITDTLTGVYNRRYMNVALPKAIEKCIAEKRALSIIFADIDLFKHVNDRLGHSAGDYLLYEFAQNLQKNIRGNMDWIARYGGDEFLVCLPGATAEKVKEVAERIRESTEAMELVYNGEIIKITCSIGIYTMDKFTHAITSESVFNIVDKRMYQAKNAGRNQVK